MAAEIPTTISRRALAAGVALAPVAGLPAIAKAIPASATCVDAELLALGRELDIAYADETAVSQRVDDGIAPFDEVDTAVARTSAIVGKIIEIKAQTLEGLLVKARALDWCHSGEFDGLAESVGSISVQSGKIIVAKPTTDHLVGDSILFDLIALAAHENREA
jgi:hypothetical protein